MYIVYKDNIGVQYIDDGACECCVNDKFAILILVMNTNEVWECLYETEYLFIIIRRSQT